MYKVIFGLCNPGKQYDRTWHSIGAECLKALAQQQSWQFTQHKEYMIFEHSTSDSNNQTHKTIYVYSNNHNINDSGRILTLLKTKYHFNITSVIVLHDEAMLEPEKIKISYDGSAKGHNGLRNIIAHFGPTFYRIKIGVGHPGKPPHGSLNAHLLTPVRPQEYNIVINAFLQQITPQVLENISTHITPTTTKPLKS